MEKRNARIALFIAAMTLLGMAACNSRPPGKTVSPPAGGGEAPVLAPEGEPRRVDYEGMADGCRLDDSFPCGTCDPACHTEGFIDPSTDGTRDGLGINPDGPGVVLGTDLINAPYTWIAHDTSGMVSKIRLSDGVCSGIFRVGIGGDGSDSPSRTTIDGQGNVYVVNRGGGGYGVGPGNRYSSVTKIAGDPNYCVDKNTDGDKTDTSTNCTAAPYALGTDECVLWTRTFTSDWGGRGVAVDFGDSAHWEGYPWVALTNSNWVYKLDPDNGNTLDQVQIDMQAYGSAIDSRGWIWSTCWGCNGDDGSIQAFDVNPASSTYLQKTAVFNKNSGVCGRGWGYGITVDLHDRVWVGSYSYPSSGKPCRFTPTYDAAGKPIGGTWWAPGGIGTGVFRGIAVDADGTIWTARWDVNGIRKFNSDDGLDTTWIPLDCGPLGVGIDPFGRVWVSHYNGQKVTKIEYNPSTSSYNVVPYATGKPGSYTYSDFTGVQRSLRNPRGTWERTFERCGATATDKWGQIYWDITTPSNSLVTIYGRSADTEAALSGATEIVLAQVPPATPPKDLPSIFSDAHVYLGKFLRIRVVMEASADGQSPVFVNLYTTYFCY
jgi:streptogramin lyase